MPLRILSLCFVLLFLQAAPVFAQSQTLDIRPQANRVIGDDLLDAFMGITHEGAYNFTREGAATNFYTETHHDTGKVTYAEGKIDASGVWLIQRNALCFTYDSSEMMGGCFRVYRVGNCYYYYSRAIPEHKDELDQDYWTARSVKQGESPTCEAVFS